MTKITTIGLDLAKYVFQVHGIDEFGQPVLRRRLRRHQLMPFFAGLEPCLIGIEACSTANYWARELTVLGHEVRLMPPAYVKPYVKRNKNDAADAEAICEAVTRPSMRYVPIKSAEQQAILTMHRARDLLVRQRTMLSNALRGHLAEFGIIAGRGRRKTSALVETTTQLENSGLPEQACSAIKTLADQLDSLTTQIKALECHIMVWHKSNAASRQLATIPGIGPITASVIAAAVPDPSVFRSGREFAAWLGLTPRHSSTGGKARLGRVSKRGDGYIRRLLVNGAQAALACSKVMRADPWVRCLLARRPRMVAAVALANKLARIAWAVMSRGSAYQPVLAA